MLSFAGILRQQNDVDIRLRRRRKNDGMQKETLAHRLETTMPINMA